MADVVIIHAADKAAAANRLSESIAAAGYDVGELEIEAPDRLADAVNGCAAAARILIWSRPLVSHMLHSGELPKIRQLANLIEVSADGITPPARGDDNRVVLISGWRGQPFHPGWQRIHLELKRLCGPHKSIAEGPRVPAARADPPSHPPAASTAPGGTRRPPLRLMLGGAVAVLLVGAAVGAVSWLGEGAPDDRPRQDLPQPRSSEPPAKAPLPGASTPPDAGTAVERAGPATGSSGPLPSQAAVPAKTRTERTNAVAAVRSPRAETPGAGKDRARPKAAQPKKYSRKYSKVMRQFCEQSGRSTPQCRTFLRSTGAD